jgi:Uncharacterised conserved protein (DUF2368)
MTFIKYLERRNWDISRTYNFLICFIKRFRFARVKRPAVLTPLLPLSFVLFYVGDLGYGSKIHRIYAEAEMIMEHERDLLEMPCGLPTLSSIDAARTELDEERRIHPHDF